MDDCRLKRLDVKPGRLQPSFQQGVTEYSVTVGSEVGAVAVSCETNDRGASYSIGSSGGNSIKLKEGEVNKTKIEVTSEDGTTKIYWIQIRRLSANDAFLAKLEIKGVVITPQFSPNVLQYYGLLACNISSIEIVALSDDTKARVKINDGKGGSVIQLNVGHTSISVEITSPNGSNTQMYSVILTRKQIPVFVRFAIPTLTVKFECPVSLAPFYKPVTIKESMPVHTYSGPIIENFVRTSKIDPISEKPLDLNWRLENYDLDQEMSQANVIVPLINGGYSDKIKFAELGRYIQNFIQPSKIQAKSSTFDKNCPLSHSVEVRTWEKQLQLHLDKDLEKQAEITLEKYFGSLPAAGEAHKTYADGQSPVDHLEQLSSCFASAIKNKGKNPDFHLKLGMVLEEIFVLEDVFGIKKAKASGAAGTDVEAQESSKAEECAAICRMYGVSKDSSLAAQLKAIDQEYHNLIEKGQSSKADHVQALYGWKSKEGAQALGSGMQKINETSLINKAYLKYCDALVLDHMKSIHHFHIGRLLMTLGDYEKAIPRLEAAIGWNGKDDLARFYLGVALVLKQDGPGKRLHDALAFLHQGLQMLLSSAVEEAVKPEVSRSNKLHAENLLRSTNVHLLQGLIQLGHLVKSSGSKECISATDIWHSVALMAAFSLTLVARGMTYQKLERVLIDAHSLLLQNVSDDFKDDLLLISSRCERFSAIIKHSTVPRSDEILQLQLKTDQKLVQIQPCSSRALYLLGNAQLALYDFKPNAATAKEHLNDSKNSFLASIAFEGKPNIGEPIPEITGQKWWNERSNEIGKNLGACAISSGGQDAKLCEQGKLTTGKASVVSAPMPAAKGNTVRPSVQSGKGMKAPTKPAQPKVVPGKPAPSKAVTPAAPPKAVTPAAPPKPDTAPQPVAKPEDEAPSDKGGEGIVVAVNQPSFHPRLGLGRVLAREAKDLAEAKKYYLEAIAMAPQEHSAYVEIAEILADKDPLGAVDIYSKLPISEKPTFDDAYVCGEIVRLLFKVEKYDDSRLLPNMITLGKVLGVASVEKYVEILQRKFKTEFLMKLYAGINGKSVNDPMMQQFFKIKSWI